MNPVAQQPERIVGSSRAEQFPQIWGPVGPGTGSLHASPRHCVYIRYTVVPWYLCAHGRVAQGGPFVGAGEGAGEDLFVHTCTHSRGEEWKGVSRVCCRSVVASASLLLLFYPCATPVAPGPSCQKRVQGSQDQGKKEAASTRHDARPARGRPARSAQPIRTDLSFSLLLLLLLLGSLRCFSRSSLLFEPMLEASRSRERYCFADSIIRARYIY